MPSFNSDPPLFSLFQIGSSIHVLNKKSESRFGLSLVQWHLMSRLVDMPATSPLALAAAVNVHPSTLTQTMKRLLKKKFIFIAEDPKDSRKKLVAMTRAGKNALDAATIEVGEWSKDLGSLREELHQIRQSLDTQVNKLTRRR